MRKIYFTKQEVHLDEIFEYKGMNVVITNELIQDNPHLFSIEGSAEQDYSQSEEFIPPSNSIVDIIQLDDNSWKDKKIENCKLNNRAINALKRVGIETLEDLSKKSIYQIRSINNVGKVLYKEIINMMNREIPKQYIRK